MEYVLWLYNNKRGPSDVVYKNSVAFTESAGTKVGMQGRAAGSDIWFMNIDVI